MKRRKTNKRDCWIDTLKRYLFSIWTMPAIVMNNEITTSPTLKRTTVVPQGLYRYGMIATPPEMATFPKKLKSSSRSSSSLSSTTQEPTSNHENDIMDLMDREFQSLQVVLPTRQGMEQSQGCCFSPIPHLQSEKEEVNQQQQHQHDDGPNMWGHFVEM